LNCPDERPSLISLSAVSPVTASNAIPKMGYEFHSALRIAARDFARRFPPPLYVRLLPLYVHKHNNGKLASQRKKTA
jgi:hypothetical protein